MKLVLMGVRYKRDTDVKLFTSYEDAQSAAWFILNKHPEDLIDNDVEIITLPLPPFLKMVFSFIKQLFKQGGKNE